MNSVPLVRRWFLSYNSIDRALAARLKDGIKRKDVGSEVFFDETSLRAGGFWQPDLAKGINQADAFVLLVCDNGLGPWQTLEYYEALDKRAKTSKFPLVLMLLDGQAAPGLPFLRQLHWIVSADPTSEKDAARLVDAAANGPGEEPGKLWRYTAPYRGLSAMEEKDADYFFGRERETVEVIKALAGAPDKLPVLIGNSGVGKSSVAQAGVLAALKRQAWPEGVDKTFEWPHAFRDSRHWCFLTLKPGTEPVHALVEAFLDTWQLDRTSTEWPTRRAEWVDALLGRKLTLRDLLDQTGRRYVELQRSEPAAFFLYIDQGEELYVRAEERQRRCFSEVLAHTLGDPHLRAVLSMRADFLGELQKDQPLDDVSQKIEVKPLREAQLLEIVNRPAKLLSARFENDHLASDISRRTAEESVKDAGALPLLSYLLDDMWSAMVSRGDGTLRLPPSAMEIGGVLVERANSFLALNPRSDDALRRVLTLKLATVREDGEPTRRRAFRSEFSYEEWRLVSELADHPYRLLVTATPEGGEAYAEVAHEAIFRRWQNLREWIAAEREFLAWRSGLEAARRAWQAVPDGSTNDALLMGHALAQAKVWLGKRAADLPNAEQDFIEQSLTREAREREQMDLDREQRDREREHRNRLQRRTRQMVALLCVLFLGIGGGLAWSSRAYLQARIVMLAEALWPKVLTSEEEHALQPKDTFKECADCPKMVVVPKGEFMMGSPKDENGRESTHKVTISNTFAVSTFEITSDEWDACVLLGGCTWAAPDTAWGRGRRPVMNVSWQDAQQYVAWLAKRTGKPYRLLSEAEWEYAARAGSDKAFAWSAEIGMNNANCRNCGSQWDFKQTAPVGSFAANEFDLHDMQGNVWEWVEDCGHSKYDEAPNDGSAWIEGGDCSPAVPARDVRRVVRGSSWFDNLENLHYRRIATDRNDGLGIRVGRTLTR